MEIDTLAVVMLVPNFYIVEKKYKACKFEGVILMLLIYNSSKIQIVIIHTCIIHALYMYYT